MRELKNGFKIAKICQNTRISANNAHIEMSDGLVRSTILELCSNKWIVRTTCDSQEIY